MSASPLVSVVIPVFNGAAYLRETLASVLAQTYRPLEVIVVDDASTDGSGELAAAFGPPVRVLRNERNRERAWSRNRGIADATGEFVALLDADDLWHPAKLERQVAAMQRDATIGLCHTRYQVFAERADGRRVDGRTRIPRCPADRADRTLVRVNEVGLLTVLVRKSILDQAGAFDSDRRLITCEDYDLWLRLARGGQFHLIDETLAYYRQHEGQSTHRTERVYATAARVRWRHIRRHPDVLAGKDHAEQWLDRYWELETGAQKALDEGQRGVAFRHYARLLRRRPWHRAWWRQLARIVRDSLAARVAPGRAVNPLSLK